MLPTVRLMASSYAYDSRNPLAYALNGTAKRVTNTYNGDGLRVSKRVDLQTVYFGALYWNARIMPIFRLMRALVIFVLK